MSQFTRSEKELLTRMLVSHAYRERLAAKRFKEALALLPTDESADYWLHVVAEEEEHLRGCYQVASELDIDLGRLVEARMLRQPQGIPPFSDWLDVLLAHALNDKAGYYVLLGLTESRVKPYARLARAIVSDEASHGAYGLMALVKYFARQRLKDDVTKDMLSQHIAAALRCLGRPNTKGDRDALDFRFKTRPASQTIKEFWSYVDEILKQLYTREETSRVHLQVRKLIVEAA
jgi:1,2-phenylacetyl-CoA epoxidase catalytic subunit